MTYPSERLLLGFGLRCCALALGLWLLAGCGRAGISQGNLGDVCDDDAQCGDGLRCDQGRCELGDPSDDNNGFNNSNNFNNDPNNVNNVNNPNNAICRDGTLACLDELTVGRCREGGVGYDPIEFCGDGFCEGGRCVTEQPQCREGARRCGDGRSVEVCDGGQWSTFTTCPRDSRCDGGECVGGGGLADIAVDRLDFGPQFITNNGVFTLDLSVSNRGQQRVSGFECGVYATQFGPQPPFDNLVASFFFDGLAPNTSTFQSQTVFFPYEPGFYTVYAYCDPNNFVSEQDEENNLYFPPFGLQVEGGQQDVNFYFEQVFYEPERAYTQGESVFVSGTVCNASGQPIFTPVRVALYLAEPSEPGLIFGDLGEGFAFFEGDSCAFLELASFPLSCDFVPERFGLLARIDPFGEWSEWDEFDNDFYFDGSSFSLQCDQACQGDEFDPRDARVPAPVELGGYELQLCPFDVDAFELPLQGGDVLSLELVNQDQGRPFVPVSLQIEYDNGAVEARSWSWDRPNFGVRTEALPQARRYVLYIDGSGTAATIPYTMVLNVEREGPLPDLIPTRLSLNEQDNNLYAIDLSVTNSSRARSAPTTARISYVAGDVDNPMARVLLTELDFGVLGAGETQQLRTFADLTALPRGAYLLVVEVDPNNRVLELDESNNTLSTPFVLGGGVLDCEDQFDPNDTLLEAVQLESGVYEGLSVCGNPDADHYLLCPTGGTLTATARFRNAQGDIDLALFTQDQRRIGQSNGLGDQETLSIMAQPNTCYILRVFLFGNQNTRSNTYDLELDLGEPVGPTCDESFEPNNNFVQASALEGAEPGVLEGGFCPAGDVDFYKVRLTQGQTLNVGLVPTDDLEGELTLGVYGPNLNFLSQQSGPLVETSLQAEADGFYYLRLSTTSLAESLSYQLTWFLIP